ncbi:MAG: ATP-binding protein [Nocardioides sp.]
MPDLNEILDSIFDGLWVADEVETPLLDFKQPSKDGPGETLRLLLDASLCFANSKGGRVVLGVADKVTGPKAFVGTDLEIEQVQEHIYLNAHPRLLVDVDVVDYKGARLLVLNIPESQDIHADGKGRAPHRVGTKCLPMDPTAQVRLREERMGSDFSNRAATSELVSENGLSVARRRLSASAKPDRRALTTLSQQDLVRAFGVVDDEDRLTRAGEILLGSKGCQLVYTYRETPAGEPQAIERLEGSLLEVYDRVIELIRLRRRLTPVNLPDGQQLQIEDFPELAVREALTNALIHRDYHLQDPVTVEHSPSVLIINSPGPLVAGVRLDNILTHPSKPRNRALADATAILELAEEIGRGVDRMYREMVRAGRPTPNISEGFDHVRVALVGGAPDLNIARYVAQLPQAVRDDTDAMLVILRLCSVKTVTAEQIAPLLQRGIDESEASLRHLASDQVGMLEATRQTARRSRPNYRFREDALKQLGTAVPYTRHKADDIERRVIQHVREYGRITNQTVQNLFNVKSDRANQILTDLRRRELLVKTSDAQRGPSVEYGEGTKFPPRPTRRRVRNQDGDAVDALPGL